MKPSIPLIYPIGTLLILIIGCAILPDHSNAVITAGNTAYGGIKQAIGTAGDEFTAIGVADAKNPTVVAHVGSGLRAVKSAQDQLPAVDDAIALAAKLQAENAAQAKEIATLDGQYAGPALIRLKNRIILCVIGLIVFWIAVDFFREASNPVGMVAEAIWGASTLCLTYLAGWIGRFNDWAWPRVVAWFGSAWTSITGLFAKKTTVPPTPAKPSPTSTVV